MKSHLKRVALFLFLLLNHALSLTSKLEISKSRRKKKIYYCLLINSNKCCASFGTVIESLNISRYFRSFSTFKLWVKFKSNFQPICSALKSLSVLTSLKLTISCRSILAINTLRNFRYIRQT